MPSKGSARRRYFRHTATNREDTHGAQSPYNHVRIIAPAVTSGSRSEWQGQAVSGRRGPLLVDPREILTGSPRFWPVARPWMMRGAGGGEGFDFVGVGALQAFGATFVETTGRASIRQATARTCWRSM